MGVLVGEVLRQRILLSEVVPGLYPLEIPGVHATDEQILEAEQRLGHRLDAQHAAVLRRGNGWPEAMTDGDLLATWDLGQGPRWQRAQEILDVHYEENADLRAENAELALPPRDSFYPFVLFDRDDKCVFVLDRVVVADPEDGAPVYLIGEGVVMESWPSFYDFWVSETALLRMAVERYQQQRDAGTLPDYLARPLPPTQD